MKIRLLILYLLATCCSSLEQNELIGKNGLGKTTTESGNFEYSTNGSGLLLTGGSWDMEFERTKYGKDELWLTYKGGEEWNSLLGDVQT